VGDLLSWDAEDGGGGSGGGGPQGHVCGIQGVSQGKAGDTGVLHDGGGVLHDGKGMLHDGRGMLHDGRGMLHDGSDSSVAAQASTGGGGVRAGAEAAEELVAAITGLVRELQPIVKELRGMDTSKELQQAEGAIAAGGCVGVSECGGGGGVGGCWMCSRFGTRVDAFHTDLLTHLLSALARKDGEADIVLGSGCY